MDNLTLEPIISFTARNFACTPFMILLFSSVLGSRMSAATKPQIKTCLDALIFFKVDIFVRFIRQADFQTVFKKSVFPEAYRRLARDPSTYFNGLYIIN